MSDCCCQPGTEWAYSVVATFAVECTYLNKPLWRRLFGTVKPEEQLANNNLVRELGKALRRGAMKAKKTPVSDVGKRWWSHKA